MNTNLFAFNLVATLYLLLGSVHEESRLRRAYGARYETYLKRHVSFYVPLPSHNPSQKSHRFLLHDTAGHSCPEAGTISSNHGHS